jgi:hypothetical protein
MKTTTIFVFCVGFLPSLVLAFVPFIDGGKGMPKIYDGWFNEQVSKQASAAVSRAIAAGKKKIEVNFPAVPNVDGTTMSYLFLPSATDICLILPFFLLQILEVKFGTPLNQKFGKAVLAK